MVRLAAGTYSPEGRILAKHVSIEGAVQEATVIHGTAYGLRTGAVLAHLLANTGSLPQPFGHCGIDPTIDELDCAEYARCK